MKATRAEATGRGWKLALAVSFLAAVLGIVLLVKTGLPAMGWWIGLAVGAMLVSAVGAWITSG